MLEIKSTDDLQSSRLNSIESLDKTQNERLNKIEALNELQSTHLTQHDEALSKQATDLSSTADAIRQEEKERAAEQQKVDEAQTAALNKALEEQTVRDQNQDTAFENYQTSQKEDQDAYRKAQERIDSDQNAAIKKAEEWQDENHDNKSLQTYIAEIVQKEVDDIRDVNSLISTNEKALAARLKTAEDTLKETKEKNDQLEGFLRVYAAATSQPTVFTLIRLDSKDASFIGSPNLDDIFNLLKGSSATLTFNIEDDPNWSAPAYSELLFNGAVVSNKRSYEGTVNSDLTVKHRNTLTGKESATKTIRFVEPVGPENPTNVSWLNTPDPVGSTTLKWSSHFSELTAATASQNSSLYGWPSQQIVEYSSASKVWTQVPASYNLPEMFGSDSQIDLRLKYIVYDIIGNSKEFIINLGSVYVTNARKEVKEYSITAISSNVSYYTISGIDTSAKSSLDTAFSGSFTVVDNISKRDYIATFIDANTIQCAGANFTRSGTNERGEYVFSNSDFEMNFFIGIQETPKIEWYKVD